MIRSLLRVGALIIASATSSFAGPTDPVGQPFAIITPNGTNSILDNFDGLAPSGVKSVTLNGTVTETFGWDAALGADFSFTSGAYYTPTTLEIGGESYSYDPSLPGGFLQEIFTTGAYDFDPFSGDGPGSMVFNFMIAPGFTDTFLDPEYEFNYTGIFADFGPRIAEFPEFGLQLSVYVSGMFPVQPFDPTSIGDPFAPTEYVEGTLNVDYMTLGLIGGTPLPTVPLPAGLPLILTALGGLAWMRRKQA